jgi:hypothetical protein
MTHTLAAHYLCSPARNVRRFLGAPLRHDAGSRRGVDEMVNGELVVAQG